MPEIPVGRIAFSVAGNKCEFVGPGISVEAPISASALIVACTKEGAKLERQRVRAKVEEMVDAADEKIIYARSIGIDPRAADEARRDGLLELLQWLDGEAL